MTGERNGHDDQALAAEEARPHSSAGPAHDGARGFASRAVHAGERPPRPDFTPTSTPIYAASAFVYDETATLDAVFGNDRPGYVYTRYANPTTRALEEAVADLEGTEDAVAFASGMGAVHAAILLDARAGDRVVAARDVYGATYAILAKVLATLGVETTFVDLLDLPALDRALAEIKPTLVCGETVSNPLLRVADLAAVADVAHRHGAKLMVDNTFASPYLVNPARLGADSVVNSATKYLGGHGDVTGGVVCTSRERTDRLRDLLKLTGAVLGPFEAWLALRGLKTLPLRVREQSANAAHVAAWLGRRPGVTRVHYPGLADLGPAADQFNGPARGGMVSFELDGGRPEAFRFLEALNLCLPATTLGDVYSLVLYPTISSHRALTPEQRAEVGIGDSLLRLSVGIEDVEDVIADLDQAITTALGDRPQPSAMAGAVTAGTVS